MKKKKGKEVMTFFEKRKDKVFKRDWIKHLNEYGEIYVKGSSADFFIKQIK